MIIYQEFFGDAGDGERFWSLVVGKRILATHVIPFVSGPETFYAGMTYPPYEWLYCVLTALFVFWHAYWVFVVLHGIALIVPVGFVLGSCIRYRVSTFWSTYYVGFVSNYMLLWTQIRSETLAFAFFSLLLTVVESAYAGFWVFAIFLVWVNVHGSFVVGELFLLLRLGRRRWIELSVLGFLAILVNPMGIGVWESVLRFPGAFFATRIAEWIATYRAPSGMMLLAGILTPVVIIAFKGVRRRKPFDTNLSLAVLLFGLAIDALRFLKFALVASAIPLLGMYRGGPKFRLLDSMIVSLVFVVAPIAAVVVIHMETVFVVDPVFGIESPPAQLAIQSHLLSRMPYRVCTNDPVRGSVLVESGHLTNVSGTFAITSDMLDREVSSTQASVVAQAITSEPCDAALMIVPVTLPDLPAEMTRNGWHLRSRWLKQYYFVRPASVIRQILPYHEPQDTPNWHLFGLFMIPLG